VISAEETPVAIEKNTDDTNVSDSGNAERPNISKPVDQFQQQNGDLQHYLDNTESLLIGTEEFITLTNTSNTANTRGVVILLPDWQQPITNTKNMAFLHTQLPDHGWTTISIQPNNKPEGYPSNALKTTEQHEENTKIIEAYQKQLSLTFDTIMKKVANFPGIFVLVTEGNHAAMMFDIFSTSNKQPPHAMVILSAYRETYKEDMDFAKTLAMSDIPLLDLYLKFDHPLAKQSAKRRHKQSKNEMKIQYRQRQLNNFNSGYYPPESLLIEIRGWLRSIGW
jgi:hypothetical protein